MKIFFIIVTALLSLCAVASPPVHLADGKAEVAKLTNIENAIGITISGEAGEPICWVGIKGTKTW